MTIGQAIQAGETKKSLMVAEFENGDYTLKDITPDFFKLLKDLGLTDSYICEKLGTYKVALNKFKNKHGLVGYGVLKGKKHEFSAKESLENEISAIKADLTQSAQPVIEEPEKDTYDKRAEVISELSKKIDGLESAKKSLSIENKRLKEQNNQLRANIQPEKDKKAFEERIRELRLENSSLTDEIKAVEKSKRELQEAHDKLKVSYEDLKKVESLPLTAVTMDEILGTDPEKEELQAKIRDLSKDNTFFKIENSKIKKENLQLSKQLHDYSENGATKEEYEKLMAAYNEIQKMYDSLSVESNSLKNEEVLLRKNLSDANLHNRVLEAKIEELERTPMKTAEPVEPVMMQALMNDEEREHLLEKLQAAKYAIKNIMFMTDF